MASTKPGRGTEQLGGEEWGGNRGKNLLEALARVGITQEELAEDLADVQGGLGARVAARRAARASAGKDDSRAERGEETLRIFSPYLCPAPTLKEVDAARKSGEDVGGIGGVEWLMGKVGKSPFTMQSLMQMRDAGTIRTSDRGYRHDAMNLDGNTFLLLTSDDQVVTVIRAGSTLNFMID